MRSLTSMLAALVVVASSAQAVEPLAPGKPAGVHPAVSQTLEVTLFGIAGLVTVGLGAVLFTKPTAASTAGTSS